MVSVTQVQDGLSDADSSICNALLILWSLDVVQHHVTQHKRVFENMELPVYFTLTYRTAREKIHMVLSHANHLGIIYVFALSKEQELPTGSQVFPLKFSMALMKDQKANWSKWFVFIFFLTISSLLIKWRVFFQNLCWWWLIKNRIKSKSIIYILSLLFVIIKGI